MLDDLGCGWVGGKLLPGPAVGGGPAHFVDGFEAEFGVKQGLKLGRGFVVEV